MDQSASSSRTIMVGSPADRFVIDGLQDRKLCMYQMLMTASKVDLVRGTSLCRPASIFNTGPCSPIFCQSLLGGVTSESWKAQRWQCLPHHPSNCPYIAEYLFCFIPSSLRLFIETTPLFNHHSKSSATTTNEHNNPIPPKWVANSSSAVISKCISLYLPSAFSFF
jgi:hypothetical protein